MNVPLPSGLKIYHNVTCYFVTESKYIIPGLSKNITQKDSFNTHPCICIYGAVLILPHSMERSDLDEDNTRKLRRNNAQMLNNALSVMLGIRPMAKPLGY